MSIYTRVNPEQFIDIAAHRPLHGRGAWTRAGIGVDYRYRLTTSTTPRLGTQAEKSLDHWAVAAGVHSIQKRLIALGYLDPLAASEVGIFGPRTDRAVCEFQAEHTDPVSAVRLVVDGIVGTGDARSLFTPLIDAAERKHGIPHRLLRGQCNHESQLDPGAVGYYVYYGSTLEFRGVDRGAFQWNSKAHPEMSWVQAYDFAHAADASAARMRGYFNEYSKRFPSQTQQLLWYAAALAHNSPVAGVRYAGTGVAPTPAAQVYLNAVLAARY